jgi:hypothetical protein
MTFDDRADFPFAFYLDSLMQVDGPILYPRQIRWNARDAVTGIAAKVRSYQELGDKRRIRWRHATRNEQLLAEI